MSVRMRSTYSRDEFYGRAERPSFGVRRHNVSLYVDAFIAERELRGLAAATLTSYQTELGLFASWITSEGHSEDPSTWTPQLVKAYLSYVQHRPTQHGGMISQMTLRSYTSRLLAFLRWLYEEQYTVTDIAKLIRKTKAPQHVVQPFSDHELQAMIREAASDPRNGKRDVAILYLLIDMGVRASELSGIRLHDVLWDQNLIKVLGKGNKERVIPFSNTCKTALRAYLASSRYYKDRADTLFQTEEGWALTPKTLLHIVKRVGSRSFVAPAYPHRFRHTFAISFLRRGGNALVLQRLLGHTSLTMTMRYVNLITDDLRAAHQQYSPLEGLSSVQMEREDSLN